MILPNRNLSKLYPNAGDCFTTKVEEIVEEETTLIEKNESHQSVKAERLNSEKPRNFKLAYFILPIALLLTALILIWAFAKSPKSKIDLSGLTENERQQLAKSGSANIQAYEDDVKGRILWHQRSAEGLHQSIIHLESAVKNDANFALAHSALADAYAFMQ